MNGQQLWELIEGLQENDLLYYTHLLTGILNYSWIGFEDLVLYNMVTIKWMCYSDFLPLEETKKREKIKKGKAECFGIGLVVATLVLSKSIDLCMNIGRSGPI